MKNKKDEEYADYQASLPATYESSKLIGKFLDNAFEKLGGNQFTPLIECSKEGCHNLEGAKNYDERDPKHTPFDQLVWRDTSL